MGTFDKIYADTMAYRNNLEKIVHSIDDLLILLDSRKKVVSEFRRRKFKIRNQFDPLLELASSKIKNDKQAEKESTFLQLKGLSAIKKQEVNDEFKKEALKIDKQDDLFYEQEEELESIEKLFITLFDEDFEKDDIDKFNKEWDSFCNKYSLEPGKKESHNGYLNSEVLTLIKKQKRNISKNHTSLEKKLDSLDDIRRKKLSEISEWYSEQKKELKLNETSTEEESISSWKSIHTKLKKLIDIYSDSNSSEIFNSHASEINNLIQSVNTELDQLESGFKPLDIVDSFEVDNQVQDKYDQVRTNINLLDNLYPQKKFGDALATVAKTKVNVSKKSGFKAFEDRKDEIVIHTNDALRWFNTHIWQISGQRWGAIVVKGHTPVAYGYKSVTPTHNPIKLI